MEFLASLESSEFSIWVGTSMLGFPTLIAIHSVGMAIAVGLSIMVALHINAVFTGIPYHKLPAILGIAAWGFMVNFITGLALFSYRATEYIIDPTFLVKLSLVFLSASILFVLRSRIRKQSLTTNGINPDPVSRQLSLLSIFTWVGTVICGRLIAYLSGIY